MNPKRNFTEEDGDNVIIAAIVFLIFVGIACIFLCGCKTAKPAQTIPAPQPVSENSPVRLFAISSDSRAVKENCASRATGTSSTNQITGSNVRLGTEMPVGYFE